MAKTSSLLLNILKPGAKIKLLGDSITHGVGGTGFKQDGAPIAGNFARNPDGFCWAKLFSEYLNEKYGATVINNACTGTTIEFVIKNFKYLVDADDDIVICTIGTNNRHQYVKDGPKRERDELMAEFSKNIEILNEKFKTLGKPIVFIANIPASAKNEMDADTYWRILHMNDINDMYTAASKKLGFEFISLYELFKESIEKSGTSIDELLCDGLHPNDDGYRLMFELIKGAFGI